MPRRVFPLAVALCAAGLLTAAALARPAGDPQIRSTDDVVVVDGFETVDVADAATADPVVTKAVCVLMPVGDSGVSGTLYFERVDASEVKITGEVKGLEPGKHGFHVHQFGDATDMKEGKSAGSHMDVGAGSPHGKPSEAERHTGDLGNITANADGVAKVDMTDEVISLNGGHSILGRGLVVHVKPDDFGQPTGNAGGRVALGVIGVAKDGVK